jgi:anthranilate synthase/aminodeoxychorismate synthase-like glutamine amidotransferase
VIAILDNRDSFTLNIHHRLAELGVPSRVVPSHSTRLDELAALAPTGLVVSPGPQGPDEAGISTAAIRALGRDVPVLGICLGHQCIAVAFGLRVAPNRNAMHGRTSPIEHDGRGLLEGVPSPFRAGRYHALAADEPGAGHELEVSARLADDGLVMGLRHRALPIEGVQFHPESVLTPLGYRILANLAGRCGHAVDDATVARLVDDAERVAG